MEDGRKVGRGLDAHFILKAPPVVFCRSSPPLLVHVYPGLEEHAGHRDWLRDWKVMQANCPAACFISNIDRRIQTGRFGVGSPVFC